MPARDPHESRMNLKKEEQTGREGVSIGFFGVAIMIMIVAMLGLFWLQTSA